MDCLQFISSLVNSLAWPAITVIVLFKFKKEIIKLIPAIQRLKVGALEADFVKELSKVAEAVEQAVSTLPDATTGIEVELDGNLTREGDKLPTADLREFFEPEPDSTALRINPTGVVMESWKELDATIREIAARIPPLIDKPRHQMRVILQMLEAAKLINADEVKSIFELQRLRNTAAHTTEVISAESARQFMELSETLAWRFRERALKLRLWQ